MLSPRDGEHYTGQFRISTYLAASSVSRLLATPEQVQEVIEGLRDLEVEHIFLELYRSGHAAEESVLVRGRVMIPGGAGSAPRRSRSPTSRETSSATPTRRRPPTSPASASLRESFSTS